MSKERERRLQKIARLSNADGAPGFEDDVLEVLREDVGEKARVVEDSLRNLYFFPRTLDPQKPTVLLDAHTDEVGLMVQAILPDGLLRFVPLGGWVAETLAAQMCVFTHGRTVIPGIISNQPPHFMSSTERHAKLSMDQLFIDIGASSAEEASALFGVHIGAPVVPDVDFELFNQAKGIYRGKAFDNRLGCFLASELFLALAEMDLEVNVVAAFASQEEMGHRGVEVVARNVKPDVAICFEGCPCDDVPMKDTSQTVLGKGPMLRHLDRGMITNPRFQYYALDLAKSLGIDVQEAVRSGGGTNGASIHLSNKGVPSIVMGVPVRYAHSHHGLFQWSDLKQAYELTLELLKRLKPEVINKF